MPKRKRTNPSATTATTATQAASASASAAAAQKAEKSTPAVLAKTTTSPTPPLGAAASPVTPSIPTPAVAPKSTSRPLLPPVILGLDDTKTIKLQIITGSYEKVLHGFIASIPVSSLTTTPPVPTTSPDSSNIALQQDLTLCTSFTDSFLFTAHTAALRCISLSPSSTNTKSPSSSKRILATGAPDERINLYTLTSSISHLSPAPGPDRKPSEGKIKSKTSNKHLGTLHEHTDTPTCLVFTPNRHKLISAGEDSQILIFRTRDWNLLSTLKVPRPKPTASTANIGLLGNGERPGGVNDIALHPSQKILLSVSKGERTLRMWNLMTGRKAGVLAFTKEAMGSLVGGRIGGLSGEGQKVRWSPDGEEYAVAFERGVVVFGMDSMPKLRILPNPISKVHQIHYVSFSGNRYALATSMEDGRVVFYSTQPSLKPLNGEEKEYGIDNPAVLGQLGGREMGMVGRVKDFVTLEADIPSTSSYDAQPSSSQTKAIFIVTSGSDGIIRIWNLHLDQIPSLRPKEDNEDNDDDVTPKAKKAKQGKEKSIATSTNGDAKKTQLVQVKQLGNLVGIYETGRRITCLTGMVMEEGWNGDEEESGDEDKQESESEDDTTDDD